MSNGERETLLEAGNQDRNVAQGFHPKVWLALGVIYLVLGILQLIFSALWKNWFGIVIGVLCTKLGTTLTGIGYTGVRPANVQSTSFFFGPIQRFFSSIVFWGSSQFQKLLYLLRWPIIAFGVYVFLLVTIHISSPDPRIKTFPSSCPTNNRFGCSRVAETSSQASRGLSPLHIESSMPDVHAAVAEWIDSLQGTRILVNKKDFLHARVLTVVFGFADDFMVHFKCSDMGRTIVEAQGQLRIGQSDLGVNARRNRHLFDALLKMQNSSSIPPGKC